MHRIKMLIVVAFFVVVCVIVTHQVVTTPRLDPAVKKAEAALRIEQLLLERQHLRRNADLRFYGTIGVLCTLCLAACVATAAKAVAIIKRAQVHTYRIGAQNEIVVHEKDLSLAAPVAMGLMNAEQLRQMNGGLDKAFELYTTLAEVQTRQMRELGKGRTHPLPLSGGEAFMPSLSDGSDLSDKTRTDPPSFRALVERGDLAPGKPMILGYERGVPRRGSFLDIYSAAVAGESGSGKTSTLLFLIGSALVSMPVRFLGIDPHYPHPKSLGFKTKSLWDAGLMTMATYKDEMLKMLKEVERIIQRRLKQVDTDTTPVVLVIDELAFLSTTSLGPTLAKTMERISMEGRKCAVYMLASSQTWLTAKTGGSSSVRDTLTSAFVHRIKPKQANLLLQDKDEAHKVKKHVKHAGEALLVPVGEESVVVKIPLTTEADMELVVTKVAKVIEVEEHLPTPFEGGLQRSVASQGDSVLSDKSDLSHIEGRSEKPQLFPLPERVKSVMCKKKLSYRTIHKETGIALSTLSNFLNGKGNLTSEQIDALLAYLEQRPSHTRQPLPTNASKPVGIC